MRGADAENRALRHLQTKGLTLIARNYRCRGGELDLVMRERDTVVIVEVRSRGRDDYGTAAESVGAHKQRKIIHATRMLLAQRPELTGEPLRFDVVAMDGTGRIEWLRNAFEAND